MSDEKFSVNAERLNSLVNESVEMAKEAPNLTKQSFCVYVDEASGVEVQVCVVQGDEDEAHGRVSSVYLNAPESAG